MQRWSTEEIYMNRRDKLKNFTEILLPDKRNSFFNRIDVSTGNTCKNTIEHHYKDIERYSLNNNIPNNVATQFDVARNVYIYAWYEYRFFNISEATVLTALEFALKERIGEAEIKNYIKIRKEFNKKTTGKPGRVNNGMKTLIEYCRDNKLIQNSGFSAWKRHSRIKAYYEAEREQNQWAEAELKRTGDTQIELPEIILENLPIDDTYDHVQYLVNTVNKHRNDYAHGSGELNNQVLKTFEMVSEFINQIFKNKDISNDQ